MKDRKPFTGALDPANAFVDRNRRRPLDHPTATEAQTTPWGVQGVVCGQIGALPHRRRSVIAGLTLAPFSQRSEAGRPVQ